MEAKDAGQPTPPASSPDRPTMVWLTGPIKLLAVIVGAVVSGVTLMSLVGLVTHNLWIQLGVAGFVAALVPLLLADRLLPADGTSRPGLLSDVLATTWMLGATASVVLGTSVLQSPLGAQATCFDDHGWRHAAWATRWTAGLDPSTAAAAEAPEEAETPVEVDNAEAPTVVAEGAEYTEAPSNDGERPVLDPAELFESWAPSVVTINVDKGHGSGVGTGFVIDDRGTIATNNHVVAEAEKITVKLFDGTKAEGVELLETNPDMDLALLRIKVDTVPKPVVLGVSADIVVGKPVVVIGNPIGLEHTMTDGLVSSRRLYEGKRYIQMSAPVSPGNSGGPVFDEHGDVIGVTVAKLWGENLNLAIPIDVLKPMIKSEYPEARGFDGSRW